jgi:RHS repeat-associated protein
LQEVACRILSNQTRYLFGLDLIYQDDGSETRYLLADGLGTVRSEVVSGAVEAVATYSPYGKVLAQIGGSGTVYGFTGEQYDSAASLLYLRARYHNPTLRVFMSRDPWSGTATQPRTLNSYLYVGDNPTNYVDPTGQRQWRPSTSPFEQIVEWLYEATNPSILQLEYSVRTPNLTTIERGGNRYTVPIYVRPDLIDSVRGDVYEIEPLLYAFHATSEAYYYVDVLNEAGGGGWTRRGYTYGRHVLETAAPNNWNNTIWHVGNPVRTVRARGTVWSNTASPPQSRYVPFGLDLYATYYGAGAIAWWLQPNEHATEAVLAGYALKGFWRHVRFSGDWAPANAPRPAPIPRHAAESLSPSVASCVVAPETLETIGKTTFWTTAVGIGGYILWNSKGCLAGPWGCLLDWITPGF